MSWNIKTPGDYINGPLTVAGVTQFNSSVGVGIAPSAYRFRVLAPFGSALGGAYIEAGEFNQKTLVINNTNASVAANLFEVQKSGTAQFTVDANGNLSLVNAKYIGWGNLDTLIFGDSSSNYIYFRTNASERVRIDSAGRLLVGSTVSGTASGDGLVKLGVYGHCISQTGTSIASGSSVDLTVVTSGAGYQGFLSVANTLDGNANSRTQTTYSVFGRGASSTITQIATANGSTSGASFTVTTPSNGVIRITNTSGNVATISAQFFGGSSA